MNGGNFGRKRTTNERGIPASVYFIRKNGVFPFFQDIGMRRWKLYKRHPQLKCFAWVYGLILCIGKGVKALFTSRDVRQRIAEGKNRFQTFRRAGFMDK